MQVSTLCVAVVAIVALYSCMGRNYNEIVLSYMCCTTYMAAEAARIPGISLLKLRINMHQHEFCAALQDTIALVTRLYAAHGEIDSPVSLFFTMQCLWFFDSNILLQIPHGRRQQANRRLTCRTLKHEDK